MNNKPRKFDLNIEKILENWEIKHIVREIIANALDEQKLFRSSDIKILKQGNTWIIKDFGIGLKYEHFTQKENDEKLSAKRPARYNSIPIPEQRHGNRTFPVTLGCGMT